MSEVILKFKVMPKDSETDLSKVESDIKSKMNPKEVEKEPIAFGLVALKVTIVVEDSEGVSDKAEEDIRGIEGVGEVEVTGMSRAL